MIQVPYSPTIPSCCFLADLRRHECLNPTFKQYPGRFYFFVMREFKILFSVTCDGSISRDAWCFKFISRAAWGDHLIYVITTQFPIFKMRLFAVDAGRDLWYWVSYFLWSVIKVFLFQYPPLPCTATASDHVPHCLKELRYCDLRCAAIASVGSCKQTNRCNFYAT